MKVLVLPIGFKIGGSEINAIELGAAVRDLGHSVTLFGQPGPAVSLARDRGLPVLEARFSARLRPSPKAVRELRRTIRLERPDIVHAYEADVCTEAFYALGVRQRVPLVGTIYGMSVDEYLPRSFSTIAGTAELGAELARHRPHSSVHFLHPPIDVEANTPDPVDGAQFRKNHGIADTEVAIVVVSRLDVWMKLDGLMDAVDTVDLLARTRPVRLVLVGDGPARSALRRRADAVNLAHGRDIVLMVGAMIDPRPAYRAADVVVGMGTSLLRGMAIGKPAVLVGELGFATVIAPDTVAPLLQQGFWGVGDGTRATERLTAALEALLDGPTARRAELGEFGRSLVVDRFSLERSASRLVEIYHAASTFSPQKRQLVVDAARAPVQVVARKIRDRRPSRRRAERRLLQGGSDVTSYEVALATPRERVERFWRTRAGSGPDGISGSQGR